MFEMHGATAADVDGDGTPDFITGKRLVDIIMSTDRGTFIFWGRR